MKSKETKKAEIIITISFLPIILFPGIVIYSFHINNINKILIALLILIVGNFMIYKYSEVYKRIKGLTTTITLCTILFTLSFYIGTLSYGDEGDPLVIMAFLLLISIFVINYALTKSKTGKLLMEELVKHIKK